MEREMLAELQQLKKRAGLLESSQESELKAFEAFKADLINGLNESYGCETLEEGKGKGALVKALMAAAIALGLGSQAYKMLDGGGMNPGEYFDPMALDLHRPGGYNRSFDDPWHTVPYEQGGSIDGPASGPTVY